MTDYIYSSFQVSCLLYIR